MRSGFSAALRRRKTVSCAVGVKGEFMSEVFSAIENALCRYDMLPERGRIVLGLSGGADSMTLADFFASREDLRPRLLCAHVNHGIRGEEADRDEAFVLAWCQSRGVQCEVLHADVPAEAARTGESEEACGRRLRYAFFARLAAWEDDRIAVAHNADDQTETILFHLIRGAGLNGLSGMAPVRGKIIRPLLFTPRSAIEAHCRESGLRFVEDSTNADDAYTRNKIRHSVVPVLKELNPSLNETLARMAAGLAADEAYLQAQAAVESLGMGWRFPGTLQLEKLRELPDPLLVRVLRRWMEEHGLGIQEKHLRTAVQCVRQGGSFSPWKDWLLYCGQGAAVLCRPEPETDPLPVDGLGEMMLPDGNCLQIQEEFLENAHKIHNLLFKNTLDYDTMNTSLKLRHRRAGDVFRMPGRPEKTLKKLFNEEHIPVPLREKLWLLEQDGTVVWLEGFGAADGFAAGKNTRHGLRVQLRRE